MNLHTMEKSDLFVSVDHYGSMDHLEYAESDGGSAHFFFVVPYTGINGYDHMDDLVQDVLTSPVTSTSSSSKGRWITSSEHALTTKDCGKDVGYDHMDDLAEDVLTSPVTSTSSSSKGSGSTSSEHALTTKDCGKDVDHSYSMYDLSNSDHVGNSCVPLLRNDSTSCSAVQDKILFNVIHSEVRGTTDNFSSEFTDVISKTDSYSIHNNSSCCVAPIVNLPEPFIQHSLTTLSVKQGEVLCERITDEARVSSVPGCVPLVLPQVGAIRSETLDTVLAKPDVLGGLLLGSQDKVSVDLVSGNKMSDTQTESQIKSCKLNSTPACTTDLSTKIHKDPFAETSASRYNVLRSVLQREAAYLHGFLLNRYHLTCIEYIKLYNHGEAASIQVTVRILPDFTANIKVHGITLNSDHEFWSGLPEQFTSIHDVDSILVRFTWYGVCVGNHEEEYQGMVNVGLSDLTSGIQAYKEGNFGAVRDDVTYTSTIRAVKCMLLCKRLRCQSCSAYRGSLRKKKWREAKEVRSASLISSKKNHSQMTKEELIAKLAERTSQAKSLTTANEKMACQIDKLIVSNGHVLNDVGNTDMLGLMNECDAQVRKDWSDPNSFQRLFWEQQLQYNKAKSKTSMRWHPTMLRWCMYLKSKSSKAYEAMSQSGFISLPSARTLFDYTHYIPSRCGFVPETFIDLQNLAKKKGMYDKNWSGFVGLLQDEVKVKEDLVYDPNSGELVGYVNLDDTSNQLMQLEQVATGEKSAVAKCVLVLMVRGVTSNMKYPLASFATQGITADFLYPIIWKAIMHLEIDCGLKVLFVTCDGASPNRRFFEMHRTTVDDEIVYHAQNKFAPDKRKIFFISDAPHLVKTTRNCFSNSFSHKTTRCLWKDGKNMSWMHIVKLYEDHVEPGLYSQVPKLTRSHIDLTAYSCMKVNLAAQVLSSSVASALEVLYGEQVSETVNFIRHMDKFFDCLNTRNLNEGKAKKNPNLAEYRRVDDPRFDYLLNDFLGYFDAWQTSVENRNGNYTKGQRSMMQLSHQTLKGLRITVHSVVDCTRYLLSQGVEFVLTNVFNQDPLEQHFGHYRHKGGSNDNPTVHQLTHTMTQLRAVGSQALAPVRGNTKRFHVPQVVDNTKLPKRRRHNTM